MSIDAPISAAGADTTRARRSLHNRPNVFLMTNTLEIGGSERQFAALAAAIHSERFRVQLGCLRRYGPLVDKVGEIDEFPLHGSFFTWQAWRSRLALARLLRGKGIAVAHAFDFYTNLMLIPTARLAGTPVVIGSQRQLGDLLTPMQFRAQAAAFRFCDRVVCNSQAAADRLAERSLPVRKLVVIPNGLAPEAFAPTAPIFPRSAGTVRVGMIARMNVRYKNQAAFLRAAARVSQSGAKAEFVLVGDGPCRQEFERMAQDLGLDSRVVFWGERQDIPAVLASLDLTVVPSVSESLPNVILESMAAGVPVVATRVGGIPEIVEDGRNGLLTPPGDDQRMAEAIERLVREPSLRKEFGQRAKEYAMAHFHWDRISEQYEELYESLLAEKDHRWGATLLAEEKERGKQVRVAISGPSLRQLGGQSVQVDLLLKQWQSDAQVKASFVPIDADLTGSLAWLKRVPFVRTMMREIIYGRMSRRELRQADVAHVFVASYSSFLLALLPAYFFGQQRGTKVLVHYHSGEARDHLKKSRLARRILRKADAVAVPSGYLVDVFREFGIDARAVPNIVNLDQFRFRRRERFEPTFICSRGFHSYYCIDDVLRAFGKVQQEYPSAQLCLLGRGPTEVGMRSLASDLRLANVAFAGVVSREEVGAYYNRADLFLNASSLDNMPVSILEAFASGTPVVTTAAGGIPYLVEHERTGLLCEPGDWKALAENAVRLVCEPELAHRIAANAYEQSRMYGWESVREKWLDLYLSLSGQ